MMTRKEKCEALDALLHWFKSQGISPNDAAILCASVCGILPTLDEQVEWLSEVMRDARARVVKS